VGSIISLVLFLKFWKPRKIWRFPDEATIVIDRKVQYSTSQLLRAFSPFILLTIFVIAWGTQPVKQVLNSIGYLQFNIPGLHNSITDINGNLIPHTFKCNYFSASGTAILMSSLIALPLLGLSYKAGAKIFLDTLKQLKFPIITVTAVLGFAYIVNDSGITLTMAEALSRTGFLFPFFAPMLGWLGVFITGSDTSANALFGKLQASTATSIGVDPVVTVAANVSGGVVGKMISPQSIAIAAAAGGLVGKESSLFRFTVKHSFIMLMLICLIVTAQAYLFAWMIPTYQLMNALTDTIIPELTKGYLYLGILIGLVTAFFVFLRLMKKDARPGDMNYKIVK